MPEYLIHPKAPLLFRNAKPFASGEGSAETLPFPSPSTISGALRTAWAEQQGLPYSAESVALLRKKQVLGPLLVSATPTGYQLLLPAPRDSLCLSSNNETHIYRIAPTTAKSDGEDEGCDLPHDGLLPLYLQSGNNSKPAKDAAAFWYLTRLVQWLASDSSDVITAQGQGVAAVPIEYRTHVAVDPQTRTAKDAHLFESAGLDFSQQRQASGGWSEEQFALLASFGQDETIENDFRTIGGESRLGAIERAADGLWPSCPQQLSSALSESPKGFRLYLATPAIFACGWLPGWLDCNTLRGKLGNLRVKLRAAAIPRWEAGTSWDMTRSKGGKGMCSAQRMVPAGSVYWFEIEGGGTALELCELWLTSISDSREKDGFGLVLPGVWSLTE